MLRTFTIILIFIYSSLFCMGLYAPSHLNWQWTISEKPLTKNPLYYYEKHLFFAGFNRFYKLNPQNGQVIWNSPIKEPLKSPIKSWCIQSNERAYLILQDSSIKAIDLNDGKELWSYKSLMPLAEEVGICDQSLIALTLNHSLIAINTKNGKPVWNIPFQIFSGIKSRLNYQHNKVFGITKNNQLFSFNVSLKRFDWSIELKKPNPETQPIISENQLIVLDQNILLSVLATTGQTLWKTDIGDLTIGSPIVSSEKIAILSFQGKIHTFDFEGKNMDGGFSLGTGLKTAIAWSGRNLLAYDSRKVLQCFQPQAKSLIWSYEIFPGLDDPNFMNIKRIDNPQVPFIEGRQVWLWDGKNSVLYFNNEKGFDKAGPKVKIIYPQSGNVFPTQKKLSLIFRTWDIGSGINPESIRINIDGRYLKYEYYLEGKLICTPPTHLKGRKLVSIKVEDWKGNNTEKVFPIYFE